MINAHPSKVEMHNSDTKSPQNHNNKRAAEWLTPQSYSSDGQLPQKARDSVSNVEHIFELTAKVQTRI